MQVKHSVPLLSDIDQVEISEATDPFVLGQNRQNTPGQLECFTTPPATQRVKWVEVKDQIGLNN